MTTGEQLRDEGLTQSDTNEGRSEWRRQAEVVMTQLIASGIPFSANDFQNLMGHHHQPHHASAVGALFGGYARRGEIVRVGTTRATKASSHARLYPTWVAARASQETLETQARDAQASLQRALSALSDIRRRVQHGMEEASRVHSGHTYSYALGFKDCLEIIDQEIDRDR